jgi:hypothetical protein
VKARYVAAGVAAVLVVGALAIFPASVEAQSGGTTTTTARPPAPRPKQSWPAVVRGNHWFVRTSYSTGVATSDFFFGDVGDQKLFCDWDGDGVRSPGVRRGITFYLRDAPIPNGQGGTSDRAALNFGNPDDIAICGDWNGDTTETIGVVRNEGGTLHWFMHNSNIPGQPAVSPTPYFGSAGDVPIVGDWDNDGVITLGVRRGITFFWRDTNETGPGTGSFDFGDPGDQPVAGNWDNILGDTFGVVRNGTWYIRNANTAGSPSIQPFQFGDAGDVARVFQQPL